MTMNIDDRRAAYLADASAEKPPGSAKLDAVRTTLADDAAWANPPEEVADDLLAAIRAESSPERADRRAWWAWVAAAAAIVLLGFTLSSLFSSDTEVRLIGTEMQPEATGEAVLLPTGAGWEIRLDLENLPPAEPGFYYQGWVWNDEGQGVSIGTFHLRPENQPVTLWSGVDVNQYPSIWISLQEEGAGAELSDVVVMRGRLDSAEPG
jgi:hypothetical protein